ncbi:MAG: HAD-IIA family hydrolase [Candidatus Heimdallarchaeota archaeon]|nr:HAD-IIA family hydrolase [Candidatus Heimdallarchaeota archaeon]
MFNVAILAAGIGLRLKPLTDTVPKSLIKVHQKSILLYQLDALTVLPEGSKIYIVVGYLGNLIKKEVERIKLNLDITIVENARYDETNNMYSLHLIMKEIDKDYKPTIIMNGDVIYDKKLIYDFVHDKRENLIAVDTGAYLKESMKVSIERDIIQKISKEITEEDAFGVSIDLYKFSIPTYLTLKNEIESTINSGKENEWTEIAIDSLLETGAYPAEIFDIGNKPWWEIDNHNDLKIAKIIFNKDSGISDILSKELFIFDLDGTLILGEQPTLGAIEFLKFLKNKKKQIIIVSNNSSRSIEETRLKASKILEYNFEKDEVFTSTHATMNYLKEHSIKRIFIVGTKNLIKDFSNEGFNITEKNPEAVLVGYDNEINYEKLKIASLLLQKKIKYFATHSDILCPTYEGLIPDAGSFLAFFKASTGRDPDVIMGKPNTIFIDLIVKEKNIDYSKIVMIGDRLYTDIRMGLDSSCLTILPLCGETKVSFLNSTPYLPDYVFTSLEEIIKYWKHHNS